METRINGCEMGAYSRLAKKWRKCLYKEYCQNKRMEHVGYFVPFVPAKTETLANIDFSFMGNAGLTVNEANEGIERLNKAMCEAAIKANSRTLDLKEGG